MRLILTLIIFLPLNGFSYTAKDIKLSENEFQRLVKPQLNNIRQDYQTLLGLLNPHLKDYKQVFNHFSALKKQEDKFISYCKKTAQEDCQKIITKYLKHVKQIIIVLNKVNGPKEEKYHPTEQTLVSFQLQQELTTMLLDIHMQLFQMNFFYKAGIDIKKQPEVYNKMIQKAYNKFNIFMIKSSDTRFQGQFLSYWNSFIKPISSYVLSQSEKNNFVRHLNDYNLRWNILNVELTKRNKKISKQSLTLLNIMHNRWKNILKITLR